MCSRERVEREWGPGSTAQHTPLSSPSRFSSRFSARLGRALCFQSCLLPHPMATPRLSISVDLSYPYTFEPSHRTRHLFLNCSASSLCCDQNVLSCIPSRGCGCGCTYLTGRSCEEYEELFKLIVRKLH